jgi:methyl-accepting chemotaxis protein
MDEKKEIVRAHVDTTQEQQWLADIDRIDAQFDALFLEQVIPAWEAGDTEKLQALDDQSDELLNEMENKSQQLIASFEAEVLEAQQDAEEVQSQTILLMITVSVVAAVIGLGFGYILSRSISRPVQVVAQTANRLAERDLPELVRAIQAVAEGNLTTNLQIQPMFIETQAGDEVGQMARAFNNMNEALGVVGENFTKMLANLRNLIGQVQEGAEQVSSASQQLNASAEQSGQVSQQVSTTIQQVAQGTNQQTQSVMEATDNVEQMARAAEGIAKGSQEQAKSVQQTSDLISEMTQIVGQVDLITSSVTEANTNMTQAAHHGVTSVEQTRQGMDTIHSRTEVAAGKVKEMGLRSKEIGRIVETIDEIADKTDMLALNAAVEAARAGEHGRGFAVVAEQVRKLSEDSKVATRDITDLIERVQDTVTEAITAMESVSTEVDTGSRLAGDTTQSLQEILGAAEGAAALADRIGNAVVQLKGKSEGVVAAIESVSAVVEENTAVAEELAASSQEVTTAMEGVASVAEESSAAAEEVSASAEEMSAQAEEVVASAEELAALAEQLQMATAQFRVAETGWADGNNVHRTLEQKLQTMSVTATQPGNHQSKKAV